MAQSSACAPLSLATAKTAQVEAYATDNRFKFERKTMREIIICEFFPCEDRPSHSTRRRRPNCSSVILE
jgi:hypothetical protein